MHAFVIASSVSRSASSDLTPFSFAHSASSFDGLAQLAAILGNSRLTNSRASSDPLNSTLSTTLTRRSGTCAALVAIVLSLTEDRGSPFRAVVLRDHVLLESVRYPGSFYETLRGGAPVSLDLRKADSDIVVRVDPGDYIPYYLDNLAARFALTGDVEIGERLFRQALDLAPESARINYNFGMLQRVLGNAEAAEAFMERAYTLGWPRGSDDPSTSLSLLD